MSSTTSKNDNAANDNRSEVGQNIRSLRVQRHLSQSTLAKMAKMHPAQLCNIEQGKRMPSLQTLENLALAFNIPSQELLRVAAKETFDQINAVPGSKIIEARGEVEGTSRSSFSSYLASLANLAKQDPYFPTHPEFTPVCNAEGPRITKAVKAKLEKLVNSALQLEDICLVPRTTSAPLNATYPLNEFGADLLANLARCRLGIGTSVVNDYPSLFESLGLHIVFCDLSSDKESGADKGPLSFSLYDRRYDNAFIFLSTKASREQQTQRLVYEFGQLFLFTANERITITETARVRNFLNFFAGRFLMPEASLRDVVTRYNIVPEEWDLPLIDSFRKRYGVSAEVFVRRLEEAAMIKPTLRNSLVEKIRSSGADAGSPPVTDNAHIQDLLLLARLRGTNADTLDKIADLWKNA